MTYGLRLVPSGPDDAPRPDPTSPPHQLGGTLLEARAGDVRAFATLVDLYYPRALRFALHMLGDRLDAEEAVQDSFVRLHRAFGTYREEDAFDP